MCMGLAFGLGDETSIIKKKNRWLFKIKGIAGEDDDSQGVLALPHRKGARPSLAFKEDAFQHTTETIYYPMKPEWKTIQLSLIDICRGGSQRNSCVRVLQWIALNQQYRSPGFYVPSNGRVTPVVNAQFKRTATLVLLDGCGSVLEEWFFDNCYPASVEFGELDMDSSEPVMIDITLRYDRAYSIC